MGRIKVGIFRGGPSGEYEVSLKTGGSIISALLQYFPLKYQIKDILITKDGTWHINGLPASPQEVFKNIDVAFNALHGSYGEDGKIQQIFDSFRTPYTGSGVAASLFAMDKAMSKKLFSDVGIMVPRGIVISNEVTPKEAALSVLKVLGPSWVVKPASSGSSLGVSVANGFNDLVSSISLAFEYSSKILVEEYIVGKEATCGIVEGFRGREHYSLPVVEIVPPNNRLFFDYNSKYSGKSAEICPAGFKNDIKKKIEGLASLAHKTLNCRHYSRSDFIVSKNGIYLLETNTLPGLTAESLLPKSLEAVGLSLPNFADHIITIALKR
ncbi:MAG: D-alanine--D-alanine ligase [Parcubacteria group bacterium]|nr:D-alanine--D-alanine ligase [Parcubacteria group bacterium]MCR4342367.1 D-alanine--D-alanine ligase [Patescibacteria group bacterium]